MNAELNVPSPSIRLNRFGRVNAKIKASPKKEVPKAVKSKISRANPNSRDNIVRLLNKNALLNTSVII